ncbi:MAG TPA: tRNA modification GTPase [Pirellulales bacterium]|nr:tRNA modification GTPase [Pirellulales bacterium]
MHSIDDTIAAIATAPDGAPRGIVRISGPQTVAVVVEIFNPAEREAHSPVPIPRLSDLRAATRIPGTVRLLLSGRDEAQPVPCDLFLWPTARSYTRQPVAELHTFGSPPLLQALLRQICAAGARLAQPGEFTLRAFLSGRIDLVQAEAVLGVIDASDRRQLDAALAQLAGGLSRPLAALRNKLLDLLADLEAGLDFVEEDIRFINHADITDQLSEAADAVGRMMEQLSLRDRADAAARVVLVGEPNVGKSSLFNALVGDAAALVSPQPGTTRDYLSARIELDGISCLLVDTAGIETEPITDPLSIASQRSSRERSDDADLRLLCIDSSRPLDSQKRAQLDGDDRRIVVFTKCDLSQEVGLRVTSAVETSAATGQGLDELRKAIRQRLSDDSAGESTSTASTSIRCHESLRLAAESLRRARELASVRRGDELIAAEIRTALTELGKIVGAIYTDDLLDRIFSRFCIGK